jgi:hypothetical protein
MYTGHIRGNRGVTIYANNIPLKIILRHYSSPVVEESCYWYPHELNSSADCGLSVYRYSWTYDLYGTVLYFDAGKSITKASGRGSGPGT